MTRLPPRRDDQRRFWRLIGLGSSIEEASACLGLSRGIGRRWFVKAGGMAPLSLVEPVKSHHLNIVEREQILVGIIASDSIRKIARGLGRAPSTVSRELKANLGRQYCRSAGSAGRPRTRPWQYSPHLAQQRADVNAARLKAAKLAANQRLRDVVADRLAQEHSPEQISARLVRDFPDDPEMRVSHETIYRSLYVEGRGALKRDLARCLRTGRALRKPHRTGGQRRPRIPRNGQHQPTAS